MAVSWNDIQGPFNVILAGVVLFVGMRYLNLRIDANIRKSIDEYRDDRAVPPGA